MASVGGYFRIEFSNFFHVFVLFIPWTYASLLHTWTYLSILFLCHKCCEWWWTSCHKTCLLFFWRNVLTWQISSFPALVLWLRCKRVWPFRYTLEQKVSYLRNVKMLSAIQRLYYRAVLCVIKCTGFQIVFSALGAFVGGNLQIICGSLVIYT